MSATVLIVIVVLCVVAALGYFFFFRNSENRIPVRDVKVIPPVYPAPSSQQWPSDTTKNEEEDGQLPTSDHDGKTDLTAVDDSPQNELIPESEDEKDQFLPVEATTVSYGKDPAGLPLHDPLLQELIKIRFTNPVVGNQLVEYIGSVRALVPEGHLKVLGYEVNGRSWVEPDPIGLYSEVAFYVQLASTKGAMNEVSLSELFQLFNRMEMVFSGDKSSDDVNEVIERSNKLADMVAHFGVQITLWLIPEGQVSIDKFEQVASDLGFTRRKSNLYEKIGECLKGPNGESIYQKGVFQINWFDPKRMALSLNVPLIAPEEKPLRLFMMAANAFAAVFGARIVDGNGDEINGETISIAENELKVFYRQMREAQIEPGSLRAHCLLD